MPHKRGEKWPLGEQRLAETRALMFGDADVKAAGDVLVNLLASDNEKERRLAAERIRDERGLTRTVTAAEQHHLHVTVSDAFVQAMQHGRPAAKSIDVTVTRDDGWKAKPGA